MTNKTEIERILEVLIEIEKEKGEKTTITMDYTNYLKALLNMYRRDR